MGRKGRTKAPEFVEQLVDIGARQLVADLDVPEAAARATMSEIARSICAQFSRRFIYVPADMEFALTERDQRLWDAYGQPGPDGARPYTGERLAQLAAEAELTTVHLYRIFKLARRRELAARQHTLPGFEAPETGA